MRTTVVLFTRDLRVDDHPALHEAVARSERVVPLFVVDPAVLRGAARNRIGYLVEALGELRGSLRERGGDLVVREGETVAETLRVARDTGADTVHLSDDVSAFAARRLDRLTREGSAAGVRVAAFPGVTVVPAGDLTPASGDHYKVFTPYWRAWEERSWRRPLPAPERVHLPADLPVGRLPGRTLAEEGVGESSPERITGGEQAAVARVRDWLDSGLARYEERHDDLPAAATSQLSADLRFGCVSPLRLATAARKREGGAAFVRQLAWRDFHHQVAAAFPDLPRRDYRPRDVSWVTDDTGFDAWREGRTGLPIVDAGMRQLRSEGFMHNRARMITAAFLTRELRVHWKRGADHFHALLTDGDIANNYGNWQWVAGTGNDTRPNRQFNPLRQAKRFDPDGEYVRRHVAELEGVPAAKVQTPWREPEGAGDYQPPLIDLD